jgi:hypothetical protein
MKQNLYIALLSTTIIFMPSAHAFDLGQIISNTAEESASAAVKEQKKEMIKDVAKDTAHKVGVTEADPYIDVAVDSADAVIDGVKTVQEAQANNAETSVKVIKPVPVTKEDTSILNSIGNFFK